LEREVIRSGAGAAQVCSQWIVAGNKLGERCLRFRREIPLNLGQPILMHVHRLHRVRKWRGQLRYKWPIQSRIKHLGIKKHGLSDWNIRCLRLGSIRLQIAICTAPNHPNSKFGKPATAFSQHTPERDDLEKQRLRCPPKNPIPFHSKQLGETLKTHNRSMIAQMAQYVVQTHQEPNDAST